VTRRRRSADTTQQRFAWSDASRVLGSVPAGEVLYEAPEVAPRPPPRARAVGQPRSLGLPFGVRDTDGRVVCWSCGHDVDESRIVRAGPGDARCAGCGAKLPFH
jgi:hypothetical protein